MKSVPARIHALIHSLLHWLPAGSVPPKVSGTGLNRGDPEMSKEDERDRHGEREAPVL